ncbi:MAG: ABC transporter ATP-binding protein [Alphaproteobacteria bacterium]|nr:ABC transporter ATP-binding protein [Alphaproteobacteria bacterium]
MDLEKDIYRFIWKHSAKDQVLILVLTLVSFPFLYWSLDLPKMIVNKAIGGKEFPAKYLGMEFEQMPYLMVLSFAFLALVLVNGFFKYMINLYKGKIGERMLSKLRYLLYLRILRFPYSRFKKVSSGELIPIITSEVEPLGGFIGDALALPIFQGGTLIVYIAFIFMQNLYLGLAAIAFYPLQAVVIPRLQKKVNNLSKRRIRRIRRLSYRLNETMFAIQDVHGNDTTRYHLSDMSNKLMDIFELRYDLYNRKFFIKFLNNFINQLTPFFFYAIGGYFVIIGQVSFGALVAVLAAYKDLASPWKELLDYYQSKEDIRIKYQQIKEQFEPDSLLPMSVLTENRGKTEHVQTGFELKNVSYIDEQNQHWLLNLTLSVPLDQHIGIEGDESSGKHYLAELLAKNVNPTTGAILLANREYEKIPEALSGRRISYVGEQVNLFTGDLKYNLLYALRHDPVAPPTYPSSHLAYYRDRLQESKKAGNSPDDINSDWIDYDAAGCQNEAELDVKVLKLLDEVGFTEDLYQFGLSGYLKEDAKQELKDKILLARAEAKTLLQKDEFADLVEPFEMDRFNDNARLIDNLIFGTFDEKAHRYYYESIHPFVLSTLEAQGLKDLLVQKGIDIVKMLAALFKDLPPGHEHYETYRFMNLDDMPDYENILYLIETEGLENLEYDHLEKLLLLPFQFIPAKHGYGLIDDFLKTSIVKARQYFIQNLPYRYKKDVSFFDHVSVNLNLSIQENILFGKIVFSHFGASEKVRQLIKKAVDRSKLIKDIEKIGLLSFVGVMGSRLNPIQKQKIGIVRALLKNPDIMIVNGATKIFEGKMRDQIEGYIHQEMAGKCIVWALDGREKKSDFDQIIMLEKGVITNEQNSKASKTNAKMKGPK